MGRGNVNGGVWRADWGVVGGGVLDMRGGI